METHRILITLVEFVLRFFGWPSARRAVRPNRPGPASRDHRASRALDGGDELYPAKDLRTGW